MSKIIRNRIIYIITIILGACFIFFGHQIASANIKAPAESNMSVLQKAEVVSTKYEDGKVVFDFFLLDSDDETRHQATQDINNITKEVQTGDVVFVTKMNPETNDYVFADYQRIDKMVILGIIFLVLVVVFAGIKGVNTVISLLFTLSALFFVFLPSILSGYNVYLSGIITCLAIMIFTLIVVHGFNKKSLGSGLGTIAGILLASVVMFISGALLNFTGLISDDAIYLQFNNSGLHFDVKAIFFTTIIIGALGAIMDVAMSIATSMSEIKQVKPDITNKELIKSGFEIGKDILGTMTNTLILAYIGSGLMTVLVIVGFNTDLYQLFNKEFLISEIFQPLIGSFGIVFTLPLTSVICAFLFKEIKHKKQVNEQTTEEI